MAQLERSGVIRVGGNPYAVGLFWQSELDAKNARREAKVAAKQEAEPADLYCIREGFVTQWGIGWSKAGHSSGMPAAAGSLAEAVAGNWLGVFETEDGWWFVMARRDAIMPEGDALYDNEDEPRARFETEFGRGGWDRVFTPAYWGIGGDTTALGDLLSSVGTDTRLKPVGGPLASIISDFRSPERRNRAVAVVATVGAVAGIGLAVAWATGLAEIPDVVRELAGQKIEPEPDPVEQRQQLQLGRERHPWTYEPPASAWLMACNAAANALTVEVPGWQLNLLSCNANLDPGKEGRSSSAQAAWQRQQDGEVEIARRVMGRYGLTPGFSSDGEQISASQPVEVTASPRGEDVELLGQQEVRTAMWQVFQGLRSDVNIARVPPPPPRDTDMPQPWKPRLRFQFSSELPPAEWAPIFDEIPGVVFQSAIRQRSGDGEWSYEGQLFYQGPVIDMSPGG